MKMRHKQKRQRLLAWLLIFAMTMSTGINAFAGGLNGENTVEEQVLSTEQTESETDKLTEEPTETLTEEMTEKLPEKSTEEQSEEDTEQKAEKDTEPPTEAKADKVAETEESVKDSKKARTGSERNLAEVIDGIIIQVKDAGTGAWIDAPDDYVFSGNESIKVKLSYTVKENWKPVTTEDLFYYDLPDFIGLVISDNGYVTDGAEPQAGTYEIIESGRIEIRFLEKYITGNKGYIAKGTVNFEGELKITQVQGDSTIIDFGNIQKEISVDPDTIVSGADLKIEKQSTDKGPYFDEQSKKTYIDYRLVVTAPRSNSIDMTGVVVSDTLPDGGYATYVSDSFKCDGILQTNVSVTGDKKSFTWPADTMKPGASHILTYTVEVDVAEVADKESNISVRNGATVTANELGEPAPAEDTVGLDAAYDISKKAERKNEDGTIEYSVTIHADEDNDFEIQNIEVTDAIIEKSSTVGRDAACKKYILGYYSFAVDGTPISITADMVNKSFVWQVGTLKPGETKVLTYKVKVDDAIWSDKGNGGGINRGIVNQAKATADNMGDCSTKAEVVYGKQWVTKSGVAEYTEDGKKIKYRVGVNQLDAYLGNKVMDLSGLNAKFTDKITTGNAVYDGDLQITKKVYDANGVLASTTKDTVSIDGLTEFTYNLDGKTGYEFTYYVRLKNEAAGKIIVGNSANVGIPGPGEGEIVNHETTTSTETTGDVSVKKRIKASDRVNYEWESKITSAVKETWIYRDYFEKKHSDFTDFIEDSVNVEFDGSVLEEDVDYTLAFSTTTAGEDQFYITFLKNIEGSITKPITITYKTVIDESLIPSGSASSSYMYYANLCQILDGEENELAKSQASTNYYPEYSITKNLWLNDENDSTSWYDSTDNTISWELRVNRAGTLYGGVAYIKEILPDGMELVDVEVHPGRSDSENGYEKDGLPTPTVTYEKDDANDSEWNIVVNNIHRKPAINSIHQVRIKIIAKITDLSILDGEKHKLTNTAQMLNESGKTMWEDTSSADIQVETLTKESIQGKATIDYTITVNESEQDLVKGNDTIEVHDVMGEGLSLNISTLKVQAKSESGWETLVMGQDYTLSLDDMTGSAFKLTVPDGRHLVISYTALVSGKIGTELQATNVASFYGYESGGFTDEAQFVVQESGATSSTEVGVVISKMDFGSFESLPGAEFGIAPVKMGADGQVVLDETGVPELKGELVNPEAGSDGKFITETDGSVMLKPLEYDVIYCIWEKDAPNGYVLDSTKHYFALESAEAELADVEWKFESLQSGALIQIFNEKSIGSITLTATKTLEGAVLENEQFTFTLYDAQETVLQTKKNDGSGDITFDAITYKDTDIGTHTYYIKESIPSQPATGYTYDTSEYKVEVTVSLQENGTLNIEDKISKRNTDSENQEYESVDRIEFVNKFVKKTVTIDTTATDTKVIDAATGNEIAGSRTPGVIQKGSPSEQEVIVDTVKYTDLEPNTTYVIEGSLRQYTSPLSADSSAPDPTTAYREFADNGMGEEVKVTRTFTTDDTGSGSIEVTFEFNGKNLGLSQPHGTYIVVYETIYEYDANTQTKGEKVIAHEEYDDIDQTIHYIHGSGSHLYSTSYTVNKIWEDNDDAEGKRPTSITVQLWQRDPSDAANEPEKYGAEVTITEDGSGNWTYTWNDLAQYVSGTHTAYEYSVTETAVYNYTTSIDDATGTITNTYIEIDTTLKEKDSGNKTVNAEDVTLVDTVIYTNLDTTKEYTIRGTLMDKATQKALLIDGKEVVKEEKLAPSSPNGTIDIVFEVDASKLQGATIVAYEEIFIGETKVTGHEDLEDPEQTVKVHPTHVLILKVDEETNAPLAGAKLGLYDEAGMLIESWISTTSAHEIKGKLEAGKTYILKEIEAPSGYLLSAEVTFTTLTDGTTVDVVMGDRKTSEEYELKVRKYVKKDNLYKAMNYSFYVALFWDEECTQIASEVKELKLAGSFSTTATFKNLARGTYYVAETDEAGNVLDLTATDATFTNEISNTVIELTPAAAKQETIITNHLKDFPDGFLVDDVAKITVNKKVVAGNKAKQVSDTFYFTIYADEERTDIIATNELVLDDASEGSVSFEKLAPGTYYIAESDAQGVPVGASYDYSVSVSEEAVTLTETNHSAEVEIINDAGAENGKVGISKSVDKTEVEASGVLTYSITVSHTKGDTAVTNIVVKDYIPEKTRF